MQNDWILDVLADVRRFALLNGMPKLAQHLEETVDLAAAEISLKAAGAARTAPMDTAQHLGHTDFGKGV